MFETIEEYIKNLFKLPECEQKAAWERVFHEMSVHTRKRKPEELLLSTRPNEHPDILKYRLANYEPITYGSMNKSLDDVYRIVNSINYSIKADDKVIEYTKKNIFKNFNLDLYLQKIALKRMIEDPNGFLVWMPSGLGLVDSSEKVEPVPFLLYSCDYIYSDKNIYIFDAPECSTYTNTAGQPSQGKVYWLFTLDAIYKVFQTGDNIDTDWETIVFYKHKLNAFPIITLGGDMNAEGYYDSFFAPYLAFGNQAIRQFSDWQAIMVQCGFPIREEFVTECEVQATVNKNAIGLDKSTEEKYSVKTELRPFSKSPYNTILRTVNETSNTLNLQGTLPYNVPSVSFIVPPVEIAKYSGESWQKLIELAEEALQQSMNFAGDSGKKVELNNEGKYSMITKLGNNYFDNIYLKSLQIISGFFKNGLLDTTVLINKPTTFTNKTEDMLIEQITTLKEKKAPAMFLAQATVDLAKKMFSGDVLSQKIFEIISTYDPLFIYSEDEKDSIRLSNKVNELAYSASIYFYSILTQMAKEKSDEIFIAMDNQKIYDEFLVRLDKIIPKPTPITDNNGNPVQ